MKTVEMQVSIAASDWSLQPGEVVELEDDLATAWIECGHCKPVRAKNSKVFSFSVEPTKESEPTPTEQTEVSPDANNTTDSQ